MKLLFSFLYFMLFRPLRLGVVEEGKASDLDQQIITGLKGIREDQQLFRTKQDELIKNYDQLHKDTKAAHEELTKVKNNLNSIAEFEMALKKVQLQMQREQRMAFGNPIERISNDPDLKQRLNGLFRAALGNRNERVAKMGEDMLKGLTQRTLYAGATPGSTFVNNELANEIYDVLATYGVWNTFKVHRMGASSTTFPITTARPIAYSVRKLSNRKMVEDTTLDGTSVDAAAVLWGVMIGVENELLEDSEFDVTSYVMEQFGEAMAFRLDHLALTADGTADENDDGMSGVFETGTAAAAASGNTTVATTDFADWVRCLTTVSAVVLNRPARWWIHPTLLASALNVADLNGRPIFLTATEAPTYGGIGSILGYPVTPAHAAPSADQASAKIAVFGDPNAHVMGIRKDFGFDASDDFAFDGVKRMYRGLARAGSKTRRATGLAVLTLAAS